MSLEHSPTKGRRLLRTKEVLKRVPCSRVTLWRWVRAGKFPAPIYLSPNFPTWLEDEIEAHAERLIAERDGEPVEA